ncbi:MAG: 50S ribosomal protein L10 [Chloroflexota bacterium]
MAITKERKEELVERYIEWANKSQAMFLTQYTGLSMKQLDDLRGKVRDAGGEFHVLKNTLGRVAFEKAGLPLTQEQLEGSTAVVFAFRSAPEMAKVITDYARTSEFVKVKGGYLDKRSLQTSDVQSLAELPPLPVMRAQLLGTISAPASKLVRTLAEPGRMIAAVLQAYADKDNAPAAEAAAA